MGNSVNAHDNECPDFEHLKWPGDGRWLAGAQNTGR